MKRHLALLLLTLLLTTCTISEPTPPVSVPDTPVEPTPSPQPAPTSKPTPPPTEEPTRSATELKYVLSDRFGPVGEAGGIHYCDPDLYPVSASEEEIARRAQEQFPQIREDQEMFPAILAHLGLQDVTEFSDEQKLRIYQESKKLAAILLEPSGTDYAFRLGTYQEGQGPAGGEGFEVSGTISRQGEIQVDREEPAVFGCPRCLAGDTSIDTPNGPIPVRGLRPGMAVWTADASGNRQPAVVERVIRTAVPTGHPMILLQLDDGRQLLASPGHPTADGRALGQLLPGDVLDGARVLSARRVSYHEAATYDLLPSGDTGHYWANGILVGSTLAGSRQKAP